MRRCILLVCLCAEAQLLVAACTTSGEPWPWNRSLRAVCFNGAIHKNALLSPDKAKRIEVEENKGFSLIVNSPRSLGQTTGNMSFSPSSFRGPRTLMRSFQ